MIADEDRLNSKLQNAVIIDLDAVRRQRDAAMNETTIKPQADNAPKNLTMILAVLVVIALFFRLIRA